MRKFLSILLFIFLIGCSSKPRLPEGVSQQVYDITMKYLEILDEQDKTKTPLEEDVSKEMLDFAVYLMTNKYVTKEEKDIGDKLLNACGSYAFALGKQTEESFNEYLEYKEILRKALKE